MQISSTNVDFMKICEPSPSSSNMSLDAELDVNPMDGCKGDLNINCKILEEIFDVGTVSEPPASSSNTLQDANLNVNLVEEKIVPSALTDMNVFSSACDTSRQKGEDLVFMKSKQRAVESLPGWETKVGNLEVSECSSSTSQIEVNGDDNSLADMVLENQSDQTCSNKVDDVGAVCEPPSSNTSLNADLNGCKGGLNMNWKVLENISDALHFHVLPRKYTVATTKKELDGNICTLATALEDGKSCGRKVTKLVRGALRELKMLSSAFDPREGRSASMNSVRGVVERLQSMRPMIDDFLKHYVISWESNVGKTTEIAKNKKDKGK